jgi:uncharacterized protein
MRRCSGEWIRQVGSRISFKPNCRLPVSSTFSRLFSWQGHGTDLLSDSLAHSQGGVPKIILHAHGSTGFDVVNMIKNMDPTDQELQKSGGIVHMAGSIIAFPGACFLWNVRSPQDITPESLAPVQLYRPKLEYLFLGSVEPIAPSVIQLLRQGLAAENSGMVIEPMDLVSTTRWICKSCECILRFACSNGCNSGYRYVRWTLQANAMGTFNILNGEDRRVGTALILPVNESTDS